MVFGMPTSLFPALALDVFKVGPGGLGLLAAAPARRARSSARCSRAGFRRRRIGVGVIVAVAVWGVAIALFGLSAFSLPTRARSSSRSPAPRTSSRRCSARRSSSSTPGPASGSGDLDPHPGRDERAADRRHRGRDRRVVVGTQVSVVSGGILCVLGVVVIARLFPELAAHVPRYRGAGQGAGREPVREPVNSRRCRSRRSGSPCVTIPVGDARANRTSEDGDRCPSIRMRVCEAVVTASRRSRPAVVAALLLGGPTAVWLIMRFANPREARSRFGAVAADLHWICPECRSLNEDRTSRCYRCFLMARTDAVLPLLAGSRGRGADRRGDRRSARGCRSDRGRLTGSRRTSARMSTDPTRPSDEPSLTTAEPRRELVPADEGSPTAMAVPTPAAPIFEPLVLEPRVKVARQAVGRRDGVRRG